MNGSAAPHGCPQNETWQLRSLMGVEPFARRDHITPLCRTHAQPAVGDGRLAVVAQVHCDDRYAEFVQGAVKVKGADEL